MPAEKQVKINSREAALAAVEEINKLTASIIEAGNPVYFQIYGSPHVAFVARKHLIVSVIGKNIEIAYEGGPSIWFSIEKFVGWEHSKTGDGDDFIYVFISGWRK